MWGATSNPIQFLCNLFISIHAPRVGRDAHLSAERYRYHISIHAPRVGRDIISLIVLRAQPDFNPRAPCGARLDDADRLFEHGRISIHAPRVGRDCPHRQHRKHRKISIHAPRVGRDAHHATPSAVKITYFNPRAPCGARRFCINGKLLGERFQSTRPVWGATLVSAKSHRHRKISIHAPRVGRDLVSAKSRRHRKISIHAPRVGRDATSSASALT